MNSIAASGQRGPRLPRKALAYVENLTMLWSVGKYIVVTNWLPSKVLLTRFAVPTTRHDCRDRFPEGSPFRKPFFDGWDIKLLQNAGPRIKTIDLTSSLAPAPAPHHGRRPASPRQGQSKPTLSPALGARSGRGATWSVFLGSTARKASGSCASSDPTSATGASRPARQARRMQTERKLRIGPRLRHFFSRVT